MKVRVTVQPTETREIEADGPDYETAKAAALGQIPEGWTAVMIRSVRE